MRIVLALCLALAAGCARPDEPRTTPVTGSYELTAMDGGTLGTILSAVRCGDVLYLAGQDSLIYRLDLRTTEMLRPFDAISLSIETLAADCDRNVLWAIAPLRQGRGLRAIALETGTGKQTRAIDIPVACFPASAVVENDELLIGGECLERATPAVPASRPESYYEGKRIGVRVNIASGEARPGLPPFESRCDAVGACVGGSIARLDDLLLASLPVSDKIGVYTNAGALQRTLPIASPAFKRDSVRLPEKSSSEDRVRWLATNSVVRRVFVVSGNIVVVHYLARLPSEWSAGSAARPQVTARVNVFARDGKMLLQDFPLADLPVGSDGESLFVVDYGPNGRQGAHERLVLQRVRLPVN
jgi:hypothetical protein